MDFIDWMKKKDEAKHSTLKMHIILKHNDFPIEQNDN